MHAAGRDLAGCIQTEKTAAPAEIGFDAAHEVVGRRCDRDACASDVQTILQTRCVDVSKLVAKNFRRNVCHIQEDLCARPDGQLAEDGAANFIASQQLVDEAIALLVDNASSVAA